MRALLLALPLVLAACTPASDRPGSRPDAAAAAPAGVTLASLDTMRVVVIGNSVASGFGLSAPEREAFPALLQQRLHGLGWPFRVEATAVPGATTSDGMALLEDALGDAPGRVALVVVELGGNDVLRLVPPEQTAINLAALVAQARKAHPGVRVLVAGLDAPKGIEHPLVEVYRRVFASVADSAGGVVVLPSLLEGVIGAPGATQIDRIHPTALGQRRIAETLWPAVAPLLADVLREAGVDEFEIRPGV